LCSHFVERNRPLIEHAPVEVRGVGVRELGVLHFVQFLGLRVDLVPTLECEPLRLLAGLTGLLHQPQGADRRFAVHSSRLLHDQVVESHVLELILNVRVPVRTSTKLKLALPHLLHEWRKGAFALYYLRCHLLLDERPNEIY
jgi:hypothetical protein